MARVSIVKCEDYKNAQKAINEALDLIGGLKDLIKPGSTVLLKPNLLSPKPPSAAVTTHPSIVEGIINEVRKLDAEIMLGDSSGGIGKTKEVLEISGVKSAAEKCGVPIKNFDETGAYVVKIPNGRVLDRIHVAKPVKDADVLISLPKLKTHALTLYTGAIKNVYGCMPGGNKMLIHSMMKNPVQFAEALSDIYSVIKPELAVMDGVIGMEGFGPAQGKVVKSRVVIASRDSVALDAVASSIMGYDPFDIPTLKFAHEDGHGIGDLDQIEVLGASIQDVKIDFKKPVRLYKGINWITRPLRTYFRVRFVRLPYPVKGNCTQCKSCEESCPTKAIKVNKDPKFDHDKCIMCYCCHEICPSNAIKLKKSLFSRSLYSEGTKKNEKEP
jgi:uncharacterized protein (DUF362 family)/Pyruvate/2-oxoacid:ferredoxin oxidoreductase delta subunit